MIKLNSSNSSNFSGLIFPKHTIREMKSDSNFKGGFMCPDNIFKIGFCGGETVKVLILQLKLVNMCVFFYKVCL